jgi:hypothetical protein
MSDPRRPRSPGRAPPPAGGVDSVLHDPFAAPVDSVGPAVGAPTGVIGTLKQMNVTEIVQMLEIGRKTATVDLTPNNQPPGTIGTIDGRVVFARFGGLDADEAFFHLTAHKAGYFRIHYGDAPAEQNITAPTQYLLLEAVRRADELGAGMEVDRPSTDTGTETDSRTEPAPPPRPPLRAPPRAPQPGPPPPPFAESGHGETAAFDVDAPATTVLGDDPNVTLDQSGGLPRPTTPAALQSGTMRRPTPAPTANDLLDELQAIGAAIWRGVRRALRLDKPGRSDGTDP